MGKPRVEIMIGLKVLAITIVFTALIASIAGGAVVSMTIQSTIDQRLQAQATPNPIDTQTNTDQTGNTSNVYQIPPNATKTSTNSSSTSHSSHHPSGSESMTAQDMYDMMEDMDMYTQIQNGTMDAIMEEMMPMMVALMSDEMKSMMLEMMLGNLTSQNDMGNQTMIDEMNKMLQTMDKSLTILNTMANASLASGEVSDETLTTITTSISQVMTMMDQLMQLMKNTSTDSSTIPATDNIENMPMTQQSADNSMNPPQPTVINNMGLPVV